MVCLRLLPSTHQPVLLVYSVISDKIIYTVLITATLILFIILISSLQPFAVSRHNIYNVVFLQFLYLFALSIIAISISVSSITFLLHSFGVYFVYCALYWVNYAHRMFVVDID